MGKKFDRQIDIINYLISGRRTKCDNLAKHFGVSTKTIKQDILELSIHYPINTYQGRGGGVELSKGYIINGYIMKRQYLDLIISALILLRESNDDLTIDYLIMLISGKHP